MGQSDVAKRKMIVETRETVDKLLTRNGNITRENEVLRAENKSMKSDILIITDKIDALQKAQDKLIKQVSYLMKATDEAARKEMLARMGIEDESVDLNTYTESLQQELSNIVNINDSIKKYIYNTDLKKEDEGMNLTDSIMKGLKF